MYRRGERFQSAADQDSKPELLFRIVIASRSAQIQIRFHRQARFPRPQPLQLRFAVSLRTNLKSPQGGVEQEMSHRSFVVLRLLARSASSRCFRNRSFSASAGSNYFSNHSTRRWSSSCSRYEELPSSGACIPFDNGTSQRLSSPLPQYPVPMSCPLVNIVRYRQMTLPLGRQTPASSLARSSRKGPAEGTIG